jgi:hypothetical protein
MTPGGGEPTITRTKDIRGTIYAFFGMEDASIPAEQVDEIEAALNKNQVLHRIFRYEGADHGFFCDQRASYNEAAAADAWEQVKQLFRQELSSGIFLISSEVLSLPADRIRSLINFLQQLIVMNSKSTRSQANKSSFSMDDFAKALEEHSYEFRKGQVVRGKVHNYENDGAYVDIGGKSLAYIPIDEVSLQTSGDWADVLPLKEEMDFLIIGDQDADGQVTLSRRQLED